MARIFITYRSEDPGWSVVLDRELGKVFGAEQVFRASRTMQMGESFPERIRRGVRDASVLLAVIGPRWLEPGEDGRRRIDDPDDWVRREIRLALESGLLIVPVLVDGVRPLIAEDLPADVRPIADRQYIRLGHKEADADIGLLIARLRQRVPELELAPARAAETPALWLVTAGLATVLLSMWLPWVDGERVVELGWTEWAYSMLFPRGVLALAGLGLALLWLLRGQFEAVAMGLVGVAGFLAVVDPLWVWRELVEDPDEYVYTIGTGLWTCVLAGFLLLGAVGAWARQLPASELRHGRRVVTAVAGAVLILLGQLLEVASHHHGFTTFVAAAVVTVAALVLVPARIPEPVRGAALSGFTMLALVSVAAAVNYVALHHDYDASLTDSMGRIVLNVVSALGLWIALSRPARVPGAPQRTR
ncbi:toll/interleukin-1 receptor domain-containing protein [Kineosporia succinea]|uniref:TIR domain-containing protein n=1 Tax=Kineosporia succinea TaxID=84632 RepID=A0ABT9PEX7_9ACTN|nr:toll/interleukin-1 receptor domain-containing protein [Kineosporia succinea]MDP9830540.1 hypothetical protein [Kineosporia succinea]